MKPSHNIATIVGLLIFTTLLVTSTGCRMQTRKQEKEEKQRIEDEKNKQEALAKSQAQKEELEKERMRIERELARAKAKNERGNRIIDARNALSQNQPAETIKITDEILETKITQEDMDDSEYMGPPPLTDSDLAKIHEARALAYFDLKITDKAITAYKKVLDLNPGERKARKNLGRILYKEKLYREALEIFKLELKDGYRSTDILFLVGRCHYELGRKEGNKAHYEAARIAMLDAVLNDPTDVDMMRWLAYLEFQTGRFQESIRLLETIRRQHPLDTEYLDLLANSYIQVNQPKKALEYLELAASIKKPTQKACLSLGDLYAQADQPARAAEWFSKAYEGDPTQAKPSERVFVARLFLQTGNYKDALAWVKSISKDDKENYDARSIEATLYVQLNEDEKALTAFEEMREALPQDCFAWLAAADIYLERNNLDKARELYTVASALSKCSADGLAGLGEVQYKKEDFEGAIKYYQQALEKSPKNPNYLVAIRQIKAELQIAKETASSSSAE